MVGRTRWLPALLLGAIGLIGVLGFARRAPSAQSSRQILAGRPECPHDWDFKSQQMPIVGSNIDVPEFHDCQRFLPETPGADYGALFAIFAADTLRTLEWDAMPESAWVAVAEIYAEGVYPSLGIDSIYNCLFLKRISDSRVEAVMAPMPNPDVDCGQIREPRGHPLTVHRMAVEAHLSFDDYPPVARWDWDQRTRHQYIGVKCGAAWCEVSDPLHQPTDPPTFTANPRLLRTRTIKGWYDEQFLAIRDGNGRTIPSAIHGIIYPDPELDGRQLSDFSTWVPVAQVALEVPDAARPLIKAYYKNLMNLDITQPGAATSGGPLNTINYCHGSIQHCGVQQPPTCSSDGDWWGRIDPADGGESRYYCVTRRGHALLAFKIPGFHIPGTARWRWLASDEQAWTACLQGCCETGAL